MKEGNVKDSLHCSTWSIAVLQENTRVEIYMTDTSIVIAHFLRANNK
jgi:hypothetical protein